METEKFTVTYNADEKAYEVKNSANVVVESRVTPGATIAELIDRGVSREEATAQLAVAVRDAW